VYKTLPSLVLPPLSVKSVAASVQIDSSKKGEANSVLASSIPDKNPFKIVSPSFDAAVISFNKVLKGFATTSYALL